MFQIKRNTFLFTKLWIAEMPDVHVHCHWCLGGHDCVGESNSDTYVIFEMLYLLYKIYNICIIQYIT